MSDVQFSTRVRKADRWSKAIALFVAMGVFAGSIWLTSAPQFSSITAAFAGIGVRFFIPYRVSMSIPAEERESIEDHPMAGSFHHGAVGGALVVGSLATVAIMVIALGSTPSLAIGAVLTGMSYVLLDELLPRG
jgi:hypothetical protein